MQFPKTFALLVKPNLPEAKFVGYDSNRNTYIFHVHSHPEKGKANIEIIKFFKKEYSLQLNITSGLGSRKKIVSVK